jgi:hypothetical protein
VDNQVEHGFSPAQNREAVAADQLEPALRQQASDLQQRIVLSPPARLVDQRGVNFYRNAATRAPQCF